MLFPKYFSLVAMAIAFVSVLSTVPSASAQDNKQPPSATKRPPMTKNPHPTTEFDTLTLKEAPPMPLLPAYTGKGMKFDSANTCPNFRFGTSYTVRYRLKEAPDIVRDWYLGALTGSGWRVQGDQLSKTNIIAMHTKQKASCGIMVQPLSKMSAYKTMLMIQYQEAK
jgi:hypothetical protein